MFPQPPSTRRPEVLCNPLNKLMRKKLVVEVVSVLHFTMNIIQAVQTSNIIFSNKLSMELQFVLIFATATIGFISLSRFLVTFFRWVWVTWLRPPKNLRDYGSWALITGSTDGIGKAMAFELASKGLNLILLGRDSSKLGNTCNAIHEKHGRVEIKLIVVDFCTEKRNGVVKKIEKEIDGLDVGLLVNNAGMAYPSPKYFHEVEPSLIDSIIGVNIEAATWVTRAVLPTMLNKKKGAIVNIGSAASSPVLHAFPLYAVYTASKAYIGMFSRSIGQEYKQHGIDIQCQIPLLVATKMTPMRRSSFFIPSAAMYSKASIRRIGRDLLFMPYWTHSLRWWLQNILPQAWLNIIFLHYLLSVREKGTLNMFSINL